MTESVLKFDRGSFGEGPWELVNDCKVMGYAAGRSPCPHCHSETQSRTWLEWTCPAVIRMYNQGGHDCTMVCLACLIEQVPLSAMTWDHSLTIQALLEKEQPR